MKNNYVIGLDFGTDSVRALLVNVDTAEHTAVSIFNYPRWGKGLYVDSKKSLFRQHPLDYLEGLEYVLVDVINQCPDKSAIKAISIDSTASTPCFINKYCTPLALTPGYEENLDAMFVLWKDHTAREEAKEISELSIKYKPNLAYQTGNNYSSEFFWAKALHIIRHSKSIRKDAYGIIELCDWIPAVLTGQKNLAKLKNCLAVAGGKLMWSSTKNDYPPGSFFNALDSSLYPMVKHLSKNLYNADVPSEKISKEWAVKLGLSDDVLIGVGNIDSYSGAVGGGIKKGTVVLNIGTSACYIAIMPLKNMKEKIVEGLFAQVNNSIVSGYVGYEAGLSAFGDVFAWYKKILCWPLDQFINTLDDNDVLTRKLIKKTKDDILDKLGEEAENINLTKETPLATDYLNGRRSPLPNTQLTASIIGLQLCSTAPSLYYALVEATAFATRTVINHMKNNGITIDELVAIGGISQKSSFVMQLLSDVLKIPIYVTNDTNSCALGAVIHAATLAGLFSSVLEAQKKLCSLITKTYYPNSNKTELLDLRYEEYIKLSDFSEGIKNDEY